MLDLKTPLVPLDFNGDGKADILFTKLNVDGEQFNLEVKIWNLNGIQQPTPITLGLADSGWYLTELNDFSGDKKTDLLFTRYNSVGLESFSETAFSTWILDGNTAANSSVIGSVSNGWSLFSTSDFNGDKKADLLFLKEEYGNSSTDISSTKVAVWTLNGTQVTGSEVLGTTTGWDLLGAYDFSGDAKSDLLFAKYEPVNDRSLMGGYSTKLAVWTINGTQVTSTGILGTANSTWNLVDIADVDANNTADLLFTSLTTDSKTESDSTKIAVWTINGSKLTGSAVLGTTSASWHLIETADFDGNKTADLLFSREDTDSVTGLKTTKFAVWTLFGTKVTGTGVVGTVGEGWQLTDINDFNGDGKSDLLFSRSLENGATRFAVWALNGAKAPISAQVIGEATADWSYLGSGDTDGNRTADLTLFNSTNGNIASWLMGSNGGLIGAGVIGNAGEGWVPIANAEALAMA